VVGYVESHDQAMVGDKTMMFRMADAAMYEHMGDDTPHLEIERAMALHKILRLITLGVGSDAYLNFMGNEFGHPEWIDFPREGNGFSYQFARRQWSLVEHPKLRYRFLAAFDQALMHLARETHLLSHPHRELIQVHEDHKLLIWRRGPLLFAVNLHPTLSQPKVTIHGYGELQVREPKIILSTDDPAFGGYGQVQTGQVVSVDKGRCQLYLPCRTAMVWG
jgi:1,4-alpha-glucan branching enzyme